MEAIAFLLSRIGVLVVLWFFTWMTLRTLRAEITGSAPLRPLRQTSSAPVKCFQRSQTPHQLLVISGPLVGSRMNLNNQRDITVGRSESNAFAFNDDFASGRRARAINRNGIWCLENLDSRNGTFLNGQRVEQPERLASGTEFRIGRTTSRLQPWALL